MTRPSVLVLAQRDDVGAAAIAALLRHRAACEVTVADEYAFTRHELVHVPESGRVDHSGRPTASEDAVEPAGLLESGEVEGPHDVILCRVTMFGSRRFARGADADYASAEMQALALSWLWQRRDVVVNQPTPISLCGSAPDLLRLVQSCAAAGLATPTTLLATNAARVDRARTPSETRRSWPAGVPADLEHAPVDEGPPLAVPGLWSEDLLPGRRSVLVCGDRLIGGPPALDRPLRELARSLGLTVGEIRLARSADRPGIDLVVGVSPIPALQSAAHLIALASELEHRALAHRSRAAA